jgi:CRP-like cAMP-binding protein
MLPPPFVIGPIASPTKGRIVMNRKRVLPFDAAVFFAKARAGVTKSKYAKDRMLFRQGSPADSVFYLLTGKVKIAVVSEQGKEAVVALLDAGDFCGEGCLTGQAVRMASISAMVECEVVRIEKAAMLNLIHDEPEFLELFVTHLLARNARVESDLVDQLFNSSEKRLARLLLILANFGKEGRPSRVSFFMNKFRQQGFIDYNGHVRVNSSLLSVVLGDPSRTGE